MKFNSESDEPFLAEMESISATEFEKMKPSRLPRSKLFVDCIVGLYFLEEPDNLDSAIKGDVRILPRLVQNLHSDMLYVTYEYHQNGDYLETTDTVDTVDTENMLTYYGYDREKGLSTFIPYGYFSSPIDDEFDSDLRAVLSKDFIAST